MFIVLFTARGVRIALADKKLKTYMTAFGLVEHLMLRFQIEQSKLTNRGKLSILEIPIVLIMMVVMVLNYGLIATVLYFSLSVHIEKSLSISIAFSFAVVYFGLIVIFTYRIGLMRAIMINSERSILILIGLVFMNYIALHSPAIEGFIQKATQ